MNSIVESVKKFNIKDKIFCFWNDLKFVRAISSWKQCSFKIGKLMEQNVFGTGCGVKIMDVLITDFNKLE